MDRVRRSFWVLFAVAVLTTGGLSWALTASAGPVAAGVFAVSALGLVTSVVLAVRILLAVDRYHRE